MKPRRVLVLLNSSSGTAIEKSEDQAGELRKSFSRRGIAASIQFTPASDFTTATRNALQNAASGEFDAVIVGGGDGTISTVAEVLADTETPMGILPMGTLNHFAKDLKIPLGLDQAIDVIASGHTLRVDLGEVNGKLFLNNSSIGIYPYLVSDRERRRKHHGLPKWIALIFAGLRTLGNLPFRQLSLEADGWQRAYKSPCVFVGNNKYILSGASVGSRTTLSDGLLSLYVTKQQGAAALVWLAIRCVSGMVDQANDLNVFSLSAITIKSRHKRLLVSRDGEIETLETPLNYAIRPSALRVFVSPIDQ